MLPLTDSDRRLLAAAQETIRKNYDSKSHLHTVGAAVRCKGGKIYNRLFGAGSGGRAVRGARNGYGVDGAFEIIGGYLRRGGVRGCDITAYSRAACVARGAFCNRRGFRAVFA